MLRDTVFGGRSFKEFSPILQGLNKRHLSEILWLLFSNGASIILGLAIIKTVARIGTVEYGKYALVLSIAPLANAIIYAPIDSFCQRFYYTYTYEDKKSYFLNTILSLLKQLFYVLLLLVLVLLLTLKYLLHYDAHALLFCLVSCGYILFFTSSVPLLSLINTMRMRKLVALISSGERFCQLLFLLGVYYLVGLNATLVLLVFLAVAAFSFAVKVKILKREAGAGPESGGGFAAKLPRDFLQLLMSFGLPLLGFGILTWLQTNGERWALQLVMGFDTVGIFCFMSMVAGTIFNAIQGPISAFSGPITWEKFADSDDARRVAQGMKIIWLNVFFTCLLTICGMVFLFPFGKFILILLGGDAFSSNYKLLPIIFMGIGLSAIGHSLTSVGFGYGRMIKYIPAKLTIAIMTILFYFGGAYYWGLSGVSWGLMLNNALFVVLIFMTNRGILNTLGQDYYKVGS